VISANIGSYPDRPACGKSEPHASPPVEIDPRSGLLADHVRQINIVFVAYIFHGLYAGRPRDGVARRLGSGVGVWVFDCHLVMQSIFIGTLEALRRVQSLGVGMAILIEPGAIIEPTRIHHQCVALPMAD